VPKKKPKAAVKRSADPGFEERLAAALSKVLPKLPIVAEWSVLPDERDAPRVDVAVGPFSTKKNQRYDYAALVSDHGPLLQRLFTLHSKNIQASANAAGLQSFMRLVHGNQNARCLLAMEIEGRGSRKHLLGGLVNACTLGRVAIGVAWSKESLDSFIHMREYLSFLQETGKDSPDPMNLLILTSTQLMRALREN
jgi:hypothetical protein